MNEFMLITSAVTILVITLVIILLLIENRKNSSTTSATTSATTTTSAKVKSLGSYRPSLPSVPIDVHMTATTDVANMLDPLTTFVFVNTIQRILNSKAVFVFLPYTKKLNSNSIGNFTINVYIEGKPIPEKEFLIKTTNKTTLRKSMDEVVEYVKQNL
jgi:hypothetical protein